MILTFKDLRDQVLRRLDEAGDTGTTKSLVNDLLNDANQQRATQFADNYLVYESAFSTEVGRQLYPLHEEFLRPLYFWNRTNKKYMVEVPGRNVEPSRFNLYDIPGKAYEFALWGRTPVLRQPATPGVVTIVSDSASDDSTAPQVLLKGERASDGMMVSEILIPDGTTPVSSTVSYRTITAVTRGGSWTGTMTMQDSDGNDLLVLSFCDLGKSYQQIFLFDIPDQVEEISYRFYRHPTKLYNDYDVPDIPAPFSQLLVYDALIQLSGYNTEISASAVRAWADMQLKWEMNLQQALLEGQSLGSQVRFVRSYESITSLSDRQRV